MDSFTAFLEIFTTLLFCVTLSMLSMMAAQISYVYWYKYRKRKLRSFYHRKRQEAEYKNRGYLLYKLQSNYKIISQDNSHLQIENEALRRELKLYSEIRSDMISRTIEIEEDNFELRSNLDKVRNELRLYENKSIVPAFIRTADQENEPVALDILSDAVIQTKGLYFEELEELPRIMQGISGADDMDAAVIVAKASGTILFDRLQEQMVNSKLHISSLIDRLEEQMEHPKTKRKEAESYFYENTGFCIKDFLPIKSA